jgi:hypothetical protein
MIDVRLEAENYRLRYGRFAPRLLRQLQLRNQDNFDQFRQNLHKVRFGMSGSANALLQKQRKIECKSRRDRPGAWAGFGGFCPVKSVMVQDLLSSPLVNQPAIYSRSKAR